MRIKKRIPRRLKLCSAILLALSSCAHDPKVEYAGKVWLADAEGAQIYRNPGNIIKCEDPKFEDFVCLKSSDFEGLVDALLRGSNCESE